jgi:CDP-paratose 2-epimerase
MGGGRSNSISILETVAILKEMGFDLKYSYKDQNRIGDHICYISDLTKIKSHFPNWGLEYDLYRIFDEIVGRYRKNSVKREAVG